MVKNWNVSIEGRGEREAKGVRNFEKIMETIEFWLNKLECDIPCDSGI